jgi:phospholipid-binding lipoprotein MlaA
MLFTGALLLLAVTGCAHNRPGNGPADIQARQYSAPEPRSAAVITVSASSDDSNEEYQDEELDFLDEEDNNEPAINVPDPLETFNRAMFVFNDRAYFWVLKPVARAYRAVAPEQFRLCVKNFFYNIAAPIRLANCMLQGKFTTAARELTRFFINSTVGCGGLNDLSLLYPDLQTHPEDLGQTFGRYGIGQGFYIVWPIIGPSSLRDTIGMVGDIFIDPVTYFNTTTIGMGTRALDMINLTSFRIGDYEAIKDAAIDPYEAIRNGYLQYRRRQVSE